MKTSTKIKNHILTGISYMIPVIVAGGILRSFALLLGGYDIGGAVEAGATVFSNLDPFTWTGFLWAVHQLGTYAMSFSIAVMTAGVAYSIAGRPAIAAGLVIGYTSSQTNAGFLGGILGALLIGYIVNWIKSWDVPKWMEGIMPVLIVPVLSTFLSGMIFLIVLSPPLSFTMERLTQWIMSLNNSGKALIGAVIGAGMGLDLGGPINKTASLAANALAADGIYGPVTGKIVGGMTPPLGAFIATLIAKKKFSKAELDAGKAAIPMGLSYITEGAIPFAAADPLRFIPCSMAGSAVAGAISVGMGVESLATHGGIFVVPMMENPLWFIIALLAGSLVTGVSYAFLKKPLSEEVEELDEELSEEFDIEISIQE